jgi:hypothetical protein
MPQIFHHSTNALAKITIYGAVFIAVALLWVAVELNRSSWNTGSGLKGNSRFNSVTNITLVTTASIVVTVTRQSKQQPQPDCRRPTPA